MPAIGAVAIPLIGFVVEKGVSLAADRLADEAQRLEAASQKTYAARALIDDPDLYSEASCILLLRKTEGGDASGVGLAILIKMTDFGADSVRFSPAYAHMNNSVALTGRDQPVNVALAFAASAAREVRGVKSVDLFTDDSITIGSLRFGESRINSSDTNPSDTGLLALPPTNATALELNVGVTESGSGVPSAKQVEAETEAVAAAIGPTLGKWARGLAEERLGPTD